MKVIDCHYRSTERVAKELSNLFPHAFEIDGVKCGSMEGFLQSLKFPDLEEQAAVATLSGSEAYLTGQAGNTWQEECILYWRGAKFPRTYKKYQQLLTRAYDECFDQNEAFIAALYETGNAVLTHDMGKNNWNKTVLTPTEYIYQLYRLRARAQQMLDL